MHRSVGKVIYFQLRHYPVDQRMILGAKVFKSSQMGISAHLHHHPDGKTKIDREFLRYKGHLPGQSARPPICNRPAVKDDCTRFGNQQPAKQIKQGGLTAAVRPQHPVTAAALKPVIKTGENRLTAIAETNAVKPPEASGIM